MSSDRAAFFANLNVGDEVYWTDPDEGLCSGHKTITEIVPSFDGSVGDRSVFVLNDGTEVFGRELS